LWINVAFFIAVGFFMCIMISLRMIINGDFFHDDQ
jgi:hypothetical protein